MRSASAGLITWLATPGKKRAYCMALTQHPDNGTTTVRGTNWDRDLPIQGPTDGSVQTYYSTSGGALTNIESTSSLSVDNAELRLNFDAITAADLAAGLWDGATYSFFLVNPDDLTMGYLRELDGSLGRVTINRLQFQAELRSLFQHLQQSIGRLITPTCTWLLGDANCTKDLTAFTVTGTLDSVSADQLTLKDAARAEAGPSGGVTVTGISNADPCVITCATSHGMSHGMSGYLSGPDGPVALNGPVTVLNPTGLTFEIDINTTDTSDYPAFSSNWTFTPQGSESGYFDDGIITITSGANAGISRRVKAYVPGQWTLQEEFPNALAGTETYSMVAGCDKTATTCRVKFSNLANFGGFPFVPGTDQIVQVGRSQ